MLVIFFVLEVICCFYLVFNALKSEFFAGDKQNVSDIFYVEFCIKLGQFINKRREKLVVM